MSFLFGGRPQLSSEQKIAAAEAEIDMVSDMYSRYVFHSPVHTILLPITHVSIPCRRSHYTITPSTTLCTLWALTLQPVD